MTDISQTRSPLRNNDIHYETDHTERIEKRRVNRLMVDLDDISSSRSRERSTEKETLLKIQKIAERLKVKSKKRKDF